MEWFPDAGRHYWLIADYTRSSQTWSNEARHEPEGWLWQWGKVLMHARLRNWAI